MANTIRGRRDDAKMFLPGDTSTAYYVGDLAYRVASSNTVLPFASLADQGTEALNQLRAAEDFVGVVENHDTLSAEGKVLVDTNPLREWDYVVPSGTYRFLTLLGPSEASSGTSLESQQLEAVTEKSKAIAVVVDDDSSARTTVRCRFDKSLISMLTGEGGLIGSVIADSTAHTNTTTAADFDQAVTFDGLGLKAGDVLRFSALVEVPTTNSTDTLTLLLTIADGTNTITIASTGAVDVADGDVGILSGELTFRAVGASGSVAGHGWASLDAPSADIPRIATQVTPSTLVTTGSLTVAVNADWSAASASDICNLQDLRVWLDRK